MSFVGSTRVGGLIGGPIQEKQTRNSVAISSFLMSCVGSTGKG